MKKIRFLVLLSIIMAALIFVAGCGNKKEEEEKRRLLEEAKKEELRKAREAETAKELAEKLKAEKEAKELEEKQKAALAQRKLEEAENRKLAEERRKKRQEVRRKEEIVEKLCKLLIVGKTKTALSIFQNLKDAKKYPNIEKTLTELANANAMIIASFNDEKGKTFTMNLRGKPQKMTIVKTTKSRVYYEFKDGKILTRRKFSPRELDYSEREKRLSGISETAKRLYFGIECLRIKKYTAAGKEFRQSGIFADSLLEALYPIQAKAEMELAEKGNKKTHNNFNDGDDDKDDGDDNSDFKPSFVKTKIVLKKNKKKAEKGNYGDKYIEVKFRLIIENISSLNFTGLSANVKLIGQSVSDKKRFNVLYEYKKNINLSSREKINTKEKEVKVEYNDNRYGGHGFKYYGYLFIFKDPQGKIVAQKASSSQLDKLAKVITNCEELGEFDEKGKTY